MFCSMQVSVLLVAFLMKPAALRLCDSEGTGRIPGTLSLADMLKYYLLSFESRTNFMDVFVTPNCIEDNTAQLKAFLNSRGLSLTLWTDGKSHLEACRTEQCTHLRRAFLHLVYIICGQYDLRSVYDSTLADYFLTDFVVAENASNSRGRSNRFQEVPFLPPYPKASGKYVWSIANGSMSLTTESETHIIGHQTLARGLWLERQQALNGSQMHIGCKFSYACQHSSLGVTLELLTNRNASFSIHNGSQIDSVNKKLSTFVYSLIRPGRYISTFFRSVQVFEQAGLSYYVRCRDRISKGMIFILPFSGQVWAALLASCLLVVLAYDLIAKALRMANANVYALIFPMLAAFFQQSLHLHSSLLMTQSSRLLYGLIILMFVILSTVFKGRLISLLSDLPLQGEAVQFVSFEDIFRKGLRLCIIEGWEIIPTVEKGPLFISRKIKLGKECTRTSNSALPNFPSINIAADGRDTFFTHNSRAGSSEAFRRELLARGYVETEQIAFSFPVGPVMAYSSVYRSDFGVTLSRGIQAGLYVRSAALTEYKSRAFHEGNLDRSKEFVLGLTVSDLRPFFLAWCMGLALSILVFVGEAILSRVRRRKSTRRVMMIPEGVSRHMSRVLRAKKGSCLRSRITQRFRLARPNVLAFMFGRLIGQA